MPGPPTWTISPAKGSRAGRDRCQGGLVAPDHQGEGALLGPGRAARQRGVEEAGAGGRHPLVLGPGHLGVDGGAVDHHLARAERGQHGVDHLGHLGRAGHAQDDDLAGLGHPGGRAAVDRAEGHRLLDRAPAARGHRHLVAGLDQVPGHGQPHGPEPDEAELHGDPPPVSPANCGSHGRWPTGARRPWPRFGGGPPDRPAGRGGRRPRPDARSPVEGGGHRQLGHGHVPADQLGVGGGQRGHVAAPDAVAVDHADRLDHGVVGHVGDLAGVGDVDRQLPGLAGDQRVDDQGRAARPTARSGGLGAGQPGVDVGDVAVLVLLAAGDGGQLDVARRPPSATPRSAPRARTRRCGGRRRPGGRPTGRAG